MNHIRAITTRIIIAASVALCAIVAVPDLTFAASNCNLKRDLKGADLSRCDLNHADLRGARLFFADLTRANLTSADLTGANLTSANLTDAKLTGANLTDADLLGAYRIILISRAELKGAKGVERSTGIGEALGGHD